MTEVLSAMGADITPTEDGMIIRGGSPLHGAETDSHGDHRVAMSLAVAALAAEGTTGIRDAGCAGISYPEFFRDRSVDLVPCRLVCVDLKSWNPLCHHRQRFDVIDMLV